MSQGVPDLNRTQTCETSGSPAPDPAAERLECHTRPFSKGSREFSAYFHGWGLSVRVDRHHGGVPDKLCRLTHKHVASQNETGAGHYCLCAVDLLTVLIFSTPMSWFRNKARSCPWLLEFPRKDLKTYYFCPGALCCEEVCGCEIGSVSWSLW